MMFQRRGSLLRIAPGLPGFPANTVAAAGVAQRDRKRRSIRLLARQLAPSVGDRCSRRMQATRQLLRSGMIQRALMGKICGMRTCIKARNAHPERRTPAKVSGEQKNPCRSAGRTWSPSCGSALSQVSTWAVLTPGTRLPSVRTLAAEFASKPPVIFASTDGAENLRALVIGRDDLSRGLVPRSLLDLTPGAVAIRESRVG